VTSGLVVVDKPAGWTSHDVVAKLRGIYGQRRVGHAGTLDPMATGVLVVGLGRVTRLLRFLAAGTKRYRGRIVLGIATNTLDAEGDVTARAPMPVDRDAVAAAARGLTGEILQVPPMVSAVKVGGRRLHALAREGREVERAARPVHVSRFDVEGFRGGDHPEVDVVVECSAGTYVRVLAADLGAALGGAAHLSALRREAVGPFGLDEARSLDEIAADPEAALLPPIEAVRGLERVVVGSGAAGAVAHGRLPASLDESAGAGPFAVCDEAGHLLAVAERDGGRLRPAVVLAAGTP
jgi:tRNA pseudouridine55 synthase